MRGESSVESVIIVPRNGLANRLQAWASAAVLAAEWDAPLSVVWEPEDVLPAEAHALFSPATVDHWFRDPSLVMGLTEQPHTELPRYLHQRSDTVILAGHDHGEQAYMPQLLDTVRRAPTPVTVLLIAGGNFHAPGDADPQGQRGLFYRNLLWSSSVTERVAEVAESRPPYVALHVRHTDRSLEAPTRRHVRRALRELRASRPEESLFIAADSKIGEQVWSREAEALGYAPWSLPEIGRDRGTVGGQIDAAADWILLSGASALVHPAASSFSTEAAIASGHPERAMALMASPSIKTVRSAATIGMSLLTYPQRRLRR